MTPETVEKLSEELKRVEEFSSYKEVNSPVLAVIFLSN
jgi:hypothetical protein